MGISIPVGSHLDEAQARRTTRQAEDYFSDAGRRAGDEFSRYVNQGLGRVDTGKARVQAAALERAYDKAADAAGKLRTEEAKLEAVQASGTATNAQKIAQSERLAKAHRDQVRAIRDATNAVRSLNQANHDSSGSLEQLSHGLAGVAGAAGSFAMAGAPLAIAAIGGAAVTAAGAIALLPAAIGGAVAGIGTLAIGLHGFSDTLKDMGDAKKFAEDIQKLSPNAQQAALSIQSLVNGPLGQLRKAVQDSLFAGMGKEIHDLTNTLLPSVQTATTGIASAFNHMATGAMDQLMKPDTAAALNTTLTNITTAFQNLAPAIAPITKAMGDISAAGSQFLPGFATSITNAANAFSAFISNARDTGQLNQWIQNGVDVFHQFGSMAWDAGRAFAALIPVAHDVLPYIAGAVHEIADALHEHPGLIYGIAGAFATWKAIEGVSALITNLGVIGTALKGLPGLAVTAAEGMSAALARVALPAWLAYMVGQQNPTFHNAEVNTALDAAKHGDQSQMNDLWNSIKAEHDGFAGGGGTFGPALPAAAPDMRTPQQIQDQIHQRSVGTPGGPQMPAPVLGWDEFIKAPNAGLAPWTPAPVPDAPGTGGGRGGKGTPLPTVPYGGGDPMALIQGFPATASLYSAAGTVLDNQQKVAQATSDLNTLLKSNTATESEIVAKRNELARAQREEHESELRLNEAKQQATGKQIKGMHDTAGALSDVGAQLDKDFGISKGLGGIVENAVKALGNILAAPFLQALGFVSKANPNEGSGLMGIAAANGAFGSQYTPAAIAALQAQSGGAGMASYGMAGGFGGNANAAIALAQSANGGQYSRGASDLASRLADCSGAVSDLVEVMQNGAANAGRLFNTESFPGYAASHGWQQGLMPGALNVGVLHGGPGGGHMAATLPNGVNFESGGSHGGIAYGGPAAGADNPEFTEHWYLPTSAGPTSPTVAAAPALNTPLPAMAGGGALPGRGVGMPQGLPLGIGGGQPPVSLGTAYPSQGGNSGNLLGGLPMDGIMAAASGLDMMMPGAGAAAKIGIQVANRTIGYVAQNAGIAASGLMETLSVGDNPKGSLGAGWLGKLAGGFAGAAPALPNMAGQKVPQQPQQQQQGDGQQQGGGNTTNINVTSREGASGQEHGEQIASHVGAMYDPPGRQ